MELYISYTIIHIKEISIPNIKRIILGFFAKYMDKEFIYNMIDFNYMIDEIYFTIDNIEESLKVSFRDDFIEFIFDKYITIDHSSNYNTIFIFKDNRDIIIDSICDNKKLIEMIL